MTARLELSLTREQAYGLRRTLADARDAIAAGWCRHALATTEHGGHVRADSHYARRWCLVGAINRASDPLSDLHLYARALLRAEIGPYAAYYGLAMWNDSPERTREDVLAVCDAVISRLDRAIAEPFDTPANDHEKPRVRIPLGK